MSLHAPPAMKDSKPPAHRFSIKIMSEPVQDGAESRARELAVAPTMSEISAVSASADGVVGRRPICYTLFSQTLPYRVS